MKKNSKLNTTQIITDMPTERLFIADQKFWQIPIARAVIFENYFSAKLEVVALPNPKDHQ